MGGGGRRRQPPIGAAATSLGRAHDRRTEAISNKIFVGNLNYDTTQEELSAFLADAGQILDVFLPKDRATGRPRGFAFVEFATQDEAQEAIERFDGSSLGGRNLRINLADDRPRPAPPPMPPSFRGGPPGKGFGGGKPKGSRRRLRSRKRSL